MSCVPIIIGIGIGLLIVGIIWLIFMMCGSPEPKSSKTTKNDVISNFKSPEIPVPIAETLKNQPSDVSEKLTIVNNNTAVTTPPVTTPDVLTPLVVHDDIMITGHPRQYIDGIYNPHSNVLQYPLNVVAPPWQLYDLFKHDHQYHHGHGDHHDPPGDQHVVVNTTVNQQPDQAVQPNQAPVNITEPSNPEIRAINPLPSDNTESIPSEMFSPKIQKKIDRKRRDDIQHQARQQKKLLRHQLSDELKVASQQKKLLRKDHRNARKDETKYYKELSAVMQDTRANIKTANKAKLLNHKQQINETKSPPLIVSPGQRGRIPSNRRSPQRQRRSPRR